MKAVGKGEGFQSFGYGLYFAENYEVARFYADKIGAAKPPDDQHAEVIYEVNIAANLDSFLDLDAKLTDQSRYVQDALSEILYIDNEPMLNGKRFYDCFPEVAPIIRIKARREWMAAHGDLGSFQSALRQVVATASEQVKVSVETIIADVRAANRTTAQVIKPGLGSHLRDELQSMTGSPKAVSQWLRKRGINGNTYFDEGSRGIDLAPGQPPTRNFVVFDARQVRVVGKTYPRAAK